MQFPGGVPGVPGQMGGMQGVPTQAQLQQLQQAQAFQIQQMQAAMAANPQLKAQFAQQQAQFIQQQRALAAAAQQAGGPAAAAAAAGRGTPASQPALKGAGSAAPAATTAVVRAAEAMPAKKTSGGKKRRAADLRLPEQGDLLIPDSPLFVQLQDAERRVDMLISRKRHELQEMYSSFRRGPPGTAAAAGSVRRKLRVYVRSEHHHQGNAPDAAEPPSWTMTISGRLVLSKADKEQAAEEGHHHKHHFTHYIRRLDVQLDPEQYPGDAGRFAWDKARHEREHRDAVQLHRLGSAPVDATIKIEMDHQPAQWRLSPPLCAALGLKGLHSLPFVLQMLWGYIKAKQLYEPSDKGVITFRCDAALRELFGADSIELSKTAEALKPHLTPPEPVTLQYTIRPDGPAGSPPDCYDFEVEVPLSTELPPYAHKAGAGRELEQLDVSLTSCLQRLAEHRRRHTMLLAFAQSPVDFVNALVAAQGRELRVASTKEGEVHEVLPSGDVFKDRWVDDCVMNYLERKRVAAVAEVAQQQQAAQQQAAAVAAMAAAQQQAAQQLQAQQQAQQQMQAQQAAAMAAAQQQAALAAAQAQQAAQQQAAAAAGALGVPGAAALQQPPMPQL